MPPRTVKRWGDNGFGIAAHTSRSKGYAAGVHCRPPGRGAIIQDGCGDALVQGRCGTAAQAIRRPQPRWQLAMAYEVRGLRFRSGRIFAFSLSCKAFPAVHPRYDIVEAVGARSVTENSCDRLRKGLPGSTFGLVNSMAAHFGKLQFFRRPLTVGRGRAARRSEKLLWPHGAIPTLPMCLPSR